MKRYKIAAAIAFGMLFPVTSATAWWQWLHQDIPYTPAPDIWFYQNFPQGVAPGQPWFGHYRSMPWGSTRMWSATLPMSSLFLEQSHSPLGYTVRVYTGDLGAQGIEVGLEGRSIVIKRWEPAQAILGIPTQMQQFGWSSQWVSLPADANVAAMRISRGNGLLEIFVPRIR